MIVMVLCCVAVIEFLPADVSQRRLDLMLYGRQREQAHALAVSCHLGSCEKFCLMMHKVAHM
jgi:hypothetical protein